MQRAIIGFALVLGFMGIPQTANATDAQVPVLVPASGSLSSSIVARGETFTFSFRVTDDVECCSSIMYEVYGLPGRNVVSGSAKGLLQNVANSDLNRTSGNEVDGRYEFSISIPVDFTLGQFYIKARATDMAARVTHLEPVGTIQVIEDNELPVLQPESGILSATSFNPGDSVSASFQVTDNHGCCTWAGVGIYRTPGQNINSDEILWRSSRAVARISGTQLDGRYSFTVQLPSDLSAGTYYVKAQANDLATWYTHLEPVGTITVLESVDATTPTQNANTAAVASSVALAQPKMRLKQKLASKSLATQIGMSVAPKAKITLTVAKASKKICKVSSGRLLALKPGNCSVTVAVTPAKTKKVKKPKTTKQSAVVAIS